MNVDELVSATGVDALQLEPVLETLVQLDWVGRLNEADDDRATRYIMLADVQSTSLEPLLRHMLLPRNEATQRLWMQAGWSGLSLRDVI